MHHFTPWSALLGGLLIGLGSAGVLLFIHRIAGISGVVGELVGSLIVPRRAARSAELAWRAWFVVGLIGAGVVMAALQPARFALNGVLSSPWLIASGLLVGFGTRLGNGCTSGHGVCGLGRLSRRSLAAVLMFMFTAGVSVFVVRHALGVS